MATGQSSGKVLEEIRRAGRTRLSEHESKELLRESGLPVTSETRAKTREELVAALKDLAFPVVIKVDSPDISHKTEAGAVKLNCRTVEEALVAFDEVTANAHGYDPAARIDGVLVQEMLSGGVECIIGMKTDAQFGPVVVFGLGGIFVEILQDISVRVAPVTHREALDMIERNERLAAAAGSQGASAMRRRSAGPRHCEPLGTLHRPGGAPVGDRYQPVDGIPERQRREGRRRPGHIALAMNPTPSAELYHPTIARVPVHDREAKVSFNNGHVQGKAGRHLSAVQEHFCARATSRGDSSKPHVVGTNRLKRLPPQLHLARPREPGAGGRALSHAICNAYSPIVSNLE
ncbi:MAG: acetate--CoA ligase family protein [Chloroflexi bacterium]|nr:acetate--CoA ligase family protein [Chloroflexota bacterium]